jgi:hypothetical protein
LLHKPCGEMHIERKREMRCLCNEEVLAEVPTDQEIFCFFIIRGLKLKSPNMLGYVAV